jgi:cell division protein FtsQ
MPAVARPEPKARSQPRKASAARAGSRAPARPAQPYAPAKLEAARGVGLSPKATVISAAVVALGVMGAVMFTGDRSTVFQRGLERTAGGAVTAFGFGIDQLHVQGASPHTKAAVLAGAGVREGDPLVGLDLDAVRARVEQVGWVKEATVVRLLPDTLVIAVKERRPMAVWQSRGRVRLIDDQGREIAGADPAGFAQLPLVVGHGAAAAAGDILPLLHARPRLMERIDALVRVDDRRWDLRLRDGGLVQLPALDEEHALMRLDQLDGRARVLQLGFAKIDLRDPEMIAVRPREQAPAYALSPAVFGAPAPAAAAPL